MSSRAGHPAAPAAILPWLLVFVRLLLAPQLTIHSVGTAFLWFHLFLAVLLLTMGRKSTILTFGLSPLLMGTGLALLRLLLPFTPGWTIVLESHLLLPALQALLGLQLFTLDGTPVQLLALLLPLWALGSLLLLLACIVQRLRFRQASRHLPELKDPHIHKLCRRVTGRPIRLCRRQGGSPYMFGLFRPTLVLPDLPYTDAQLDRILRHEWQHHLGRDGWIKLMLDLLCALLWWDPLLWLLRRKSVHVLELRCDFGVLRALPEAARADYYDVILQTARMSRTAQHSPFTSALAVAPIVERFELGLDYASIERKSARYARLLHLVLLVCWALSYIIIFRTGTPAWT